MLIFKVFGALMVGLGGGLICHTLNREAQLSCKRAEAWCSLIGTVKGEIECFSLPISEILKRVDISRFAECGYTKTSVPESLCELVSKTSFSDKETEKIVRNFCSEFGMGYRDEQIKRCEYYRGLLEERKKVLATDLPTKKRLYSTLCVSGSLALLILFL